MVEAVVPFMGESMSDGTLAKFLKNPGDKVEVHEPIAQIETDKVTIDVASLEAGVIQKYVATERDTVEPGTKIAVISKSGEGVAHVAPFEKTTDKAVSQPPPVELSEEDKKSLKLKALSLSVFLLLPLNALLQNPNFPLKKGKDATNLMKLRSDYKDSFVEKHGVKLGLMSRFVKAAVSGLQNQSIINAVIDGDDIIYRDYIDISIAVGTPKMQPF
ncbi:unnamed protein product [Camellia sinensis]